MTNPTQKMIDFAERIAYELDLDEPNYEDYEEVGEFISEWKQDYYDSINDKNYK